MKRLLAVNLSMTLIFALGLISCDKDKKLTGPTEPSPAGQATSQPVAKATTQATSDGICDRPQPVQNAILSRLSMSNCAEVSASDLASITGRLSVGSYVGNEKLTELPSGTFAGLTKLRELGLSGNDLAALPADVFDDLDSLRILDLNGNDLAALPADVFDGLTKLERLLLNENDLAALPADVFDDLDSLKALSLSFNDLAALPADVFDGLTKLERLTLIRNDLSTLPADIFDGLTKLELLALGSNDLSALPADVFADLDNLKFLDLDYNDLEALPADVFDDLDNLEDLNVGFNDIDLDELPSDFFDAFPKLRWLSLAGIGKDLGDNTGTMTTLSYDWFDSLSELEVLDLEWNELSTLPADTFDGFTNLEVLRLGANDLSALPADIFDGLTKLKWLGLNNNDLEALPGNSDLEALPGGLFKGLSNLESVNLGHNPGAPFTFTAELEQQDDGAVMVKVDDGAPYDMAVTLSAEGGTLSSTDVTVAGGSLESGAINVTPNGQRPTQVTVSVESAAFKKKIYSDEGVQAGLGESLTLTFRALVNSPPPEEEEEPLESSAATTESGDYERKPVQVSKPSATNITHNSARIEWKKARRAEEYIVTRRALYADNPESSLSPIATTSELSYDDTDLVPDTEYIYRIVARNNVGEAQRSSHLKFRTLPEPVVEVEEEQVSEEVIPEEEEEEPLETDTATTESGDYERKPVQVSKPSATNITHNSARIEWKKARRAEEYIVTRRALYADNPESSLSPVHTTSGLSYDDTDLVPDTEYIYRIVARNNVGEAQRSSHLKFRTLSEP